ncbi:MAG: nitroreductase family protein [Pseudomonadales bacterium]|nr:nitroreductase family protein [Pseudomonadales bacterium]
MSLLIQPFVRAHLSIQWRRRLRSLIAVPLRIIELIENYFYDLRVFTRYSSSLQFLSSQQHIQSWIDADCHKLEKGLTLKSPRPGFGRLVAERLLNLLIEYRDKFGDDMSVQNAISVLLAYERFNRSVDVKFPDLFQRINELSGDSEMAVSAGVHFIDRKQWIEDACQDLRPFFKSRRSVRDFSDQIVSLDQLRRAVEMAMYSPSVCNRQAAKVHVYVKPEELKEVIQCQKGNAGFGENVSALLMVTVNRECFFCAAERNQCWIDGGLFSMSLVYALHSLGLGTCCLNWSADKKQDQQLRMTTKIDDSEAVIMMIAVGHLKENFKVAMSTRKELSHFMITGIQDL